MRSIFFVDGREISFEKDNVPFSEEIIIQRGYDLIEKLSDEKEFLTSWSESFVPECTRDWTYVNTLDTKS